MPDLNQRRGSDPSPGHTAHFDAFDVFETLGRGGMGEVRRGVHRATGTPVALKMFTGEAARSGTFQASFNREIQATAALVHPSIVEILDFGEVPPGRDAPAGTPYVVLELADRGTFTQAAARGLTWYDVKNVVLSVLDALAHAHARGLVHRDLKPDNVLGFSTAQGIGWKLADFGIARHIDEESLEHGLVGTPAFMAPEQFTGAWRDIGPWTDLYALGCMTYWLVGEHLPFDAPAPLQLAFKHCHEEPQPLQPVIEHPPGFTDWVARLMAKDPLARFRKAADAAWALLKLGDPEQAQRRSTPQAHGSADDTILMHTPTPAAAPTLALVVDEIDVLESVGVVEEVSLPPLPSTWRGEHTRRGASLAVQSPRLFGLREIALVARESERDRLWGALREVHAEGRPRVVLIEGTSGCGKSRLARWLCDRAEEVGAADVWRATHSTDVAQNDLGAMFARHLRVTGLEGEELRTRLAAQLPAGVDNRVNVAHQIARLIEARESSEVRATLVAHLLRVVSMKRPIIIWFDDLQWSLEAWRVVDALLERDEGNVLVLGTIQSEALAERPTFSELLQDRLDHPHVTHVRLSPLTEGDGLELIRTLLDLDTALAHRLARRTAGNPLFAVHLLADWVERGYLQPGPAGFRLVEGVEGVIPDDLHAVWAARMDNLCRSRSADDRIALELAAVLGRQVDLEEWTSACAEAGVRPARDLVAHLVDSRFVVRGDSGWAFTHGMLVESLHRLIRGRGEWEARNATVARALDARMREAKGERLAGRVGRHRFEARDHAAAAPLLFEGARWAIRERDWLASIELLDLHQAAREQVETTNTRELLEARLMRAHTLVWLRRFEEATQLVDVVRDIAFASGHLAIAAAALRERAYIGQQSESLDGAFFARKALELSERIDDVPGQIEAHLRLADERAYTRPDEEALHHYRIALDLARSEEDVPSVAWALWGLGYVYEQRLELDEALRYAEEGWQLCQAHDLPIALNVLSTVAEIQALRGDHEAARKNFRFVYDTSAARGTLHSVIILNVALAECFAQNFAAARRWRARTVGVIERGAQLFGVCMDLLLCVHDREFARWPSLIETLAGVLERSRLVEVPSTILAERAARLAEEAQHHQEARELYPFVARLWSALGHEERAERARARGC